MKSKAHCQFDHLVQFYRTDRHLISSVSSFIGAGIRAGAAALVVSTPFHWAALERSLKLANLEVNRAKSDGTLLWLNGPALLRDLSRPDGLDMQTYETQLREVLARLTPLSHGHPVQIYGEFADLLWVAGYRAEALAEEALCNQLSEVYRFNLMCSYRVAPTTDRQMLHALCHAHSHVLAAEEVGEIHSLEDIPADAVRPGEREMVRSQCLRDQRVVDGLRDELATTTFRLLLQAQGLLAKLPEDAVPQWRGLVTDLDRTLHDSLTLAEELSPLSRQTPDLMTGLAGHACILRERWGASCDIDVPKEFVGPGRAERGLLFGILSELMDRVTARHGATQLLVQVRRLRGKYQLSFSHDGDNFILMGHEDDELRRLVYRAKMFSIETTFLRKGSTGLQMTAHWR